MVRRRENDKTYFYYYERGKKVYLGTLRDDTVIEKIKYIYANLDELREEERKEFLEWVNELYTTLNSILGKNSNITISNLGNDEINKKLDKILELLSEIKEEKKKSVQDLDRIYEEMKDSLGYVRIDDLRKELGMSLEDFMNTFHDYILEHYELIQGGKEGFIRNGIIYGIIRRKK